MTQEKREIIEVLLANRLYLYSLLYRCYGRDPDREQLELLASEQTGEGFALLGGEVLEKVPTFLTEIRKDLEEPEFLDRVKNEYMHLFVGPDKLIAPPWESVYQGEDAVLFQEVTLEVRKAYRAFGLCAEAYQRVPDDSLALELAFMSTLAERALDAFHAGDSAGVRTNLNGSAEFLRKHLLRWIPKFLERLAKSPTVCLYPQLSLILDSFLKKDAEMTEEILEEYQAEELQEHAADH
ncbi:MAG: molecular chaperone TorD family protein [Oscillospiraceae bacterium]|nr:molecular chaperone TorD family protein [Oscillospiraceae bacterium]